MILSKIQTFFLEIGTLDLKFACINKGNKIAKTTVKKNAAWEIFLAKLSYVL